MKNRILITVLVILAMLAFALPAQATSSQWLSFVPCTHNDPDGGDVAIGQAQLFVQVVDLGAAGVRFHFVNTGPQASSITEVYFMDGALLAIYNILDFPPAVDFGFPSNHNNLPGGNNCVPAFVSTVGFSADSLPPTQPNGVNPGEHLGIDFTLQTGKTFNDVINDLTSGALRIGIHVQGFADGESESFVNDGWTAVEMASFKAETLKGAVRLKWATGTEINNAGFNVYRASADGASRVRLNGALIAPQGDNVNGAAYSFLDKPGLGTFLYWVEDVDANGVTTLHGPVKVTLSSPIRSPRFRPLPPVR